MLTATLIALGDELRFLKGKSNLMKAFYIFTATLESIHSVYKDILLNIFHKKTSNIAMFSYIFSDT